MSDGRADPSAPRPQRHPSSGLSSTSMPANLQPTALYRPLIYQYKCRGALHSSSLDGATNDGGGGSSSSSNGDGLPLCRGLESKLRHLQTLPTVSSREDAVEMFQDAVGSQRYVAVGGLGEEGEDYADRRRTEGVGGGAGAIAQQQQQQQPAEGAGAGERTYVSCYGSTDVNVLMVEEIELPPATLVGGGNGDMLFPPHPGIMNPFDPLSLFRAFDEPASGDGGEGPSGAPGRRADEARAQSFGGFGGGLFGPIGGGGGGGGSTMRSVSTSTRTGADGKRITTKETTTVGPDGRRETRTETVVRNRDGTTETTVTGSDGDDLGNRGPNDETRHDAGHLLEQQRQQQQQQQEQRRKYSEWQAQTPHREPEMVAVLPECRLGVTVSTIEDDTQGDTVMALRIGPVEVAVGDSYDVLEEEREMAQTGSGARRAYRDGSSIGENGDDDDDGFGKEGRRNAAARPNSILNPAALNQEKLLSTLERTAQSMKKNAETIRDELKDDFPSRVMRSGEKIVGNFGKTFERSAKVAGDLWKMWSEEDDE